MSRLLAAFALCLTVCAAPAAAQSVFVEGTAFAGIERRTHTEIVSSDINASGPLDLNGTVAGGGFGVGTWLTPHVTVRLEVSLPDSVSYSNQSSEIIRIAANQTLTYTETVEASERLRTAGALIGYHTERRHGIQLGYLGGAAFVFSQMHFKSMSQFPVFLPAADLLAIGLTVPVRTLETDATSYGVTAEAGLDVDIALGRRFSVVPQVRAIGFDNGLSIRPGVAFRASW
jgi:hypothetical protein